MPSLAVAALIASTAWAARAQPDQPAPNVTADTAGNGAAPTPELGGRYELEPEVVSTYSTNLFHEQRRREDDFSLNGPGERYAGMRGPEDLVTEAKLTGSHEWEVDAHRNAKASLGGGYVFHARNAIANYFSIEAGADYDVARHDRISIEAEFIPRRFKKNYAANELAGNRIYEHAYYRDLAVSPGWRHKWTKSWKTNVAYELGFRWYEPPFENRNIVSHYAEVLLIHDFGRIEPGLGVGGALATTPSGIEFSIPVNRSYRDVVLLALLDIDLPAGFAVGADVEYRIRSYTTDEPANDTYFDRTDRRLSLALEVEKKVTRMFAFMAEAGFIENATNRHDHPGVSPEDLGYEELLFSLGARARL